MLYSLEGDDRKDLDGAVQRIMQEIGVIDAHCDTVHNFKEVRNYDFSRKNDASHLDLPRMKKGGISVQFFALYVEPEYKPCDALKRSLQLLDSYFTTVDPLCSDIETVHNVKELENVIDKAKIASILSIEGGEALEEDLGALRMLYRLGVRSIGLTWNQRNQIADGIDERDTKGGLTSFGRNVVKEMNRLGMIVDLSHISLMGFYDVLNVTHQPVIVSHANTYSLCPHPRNLTDEQLVEISKNGGVVGLTFCPSFIDLQAPGLDKLLDHFVHAVDVAGIDHVGIGSDFDGMGEAVQGLEDVSCLPVLAKGLFLRGFKKEEVEKILFNNFFRIISEVL